MRRRYLTGRATIKVDEKTILIDAAQMASSKALRSSRALGLTIKVIKDNNIVSIKPDKTEEILKPLAKSNVDISDLEKGMILQKH